MIEAGSLEIADILRQYGDAYRQTYPTSPLQERVLHDLTVCRTEQLGGHLYVCENCGVITEHYNACRNRHCPRCQALDRERWLEKRQEEVLPVEYFHLVFTVPHELNPLFLTDPKELYNLLFHSAADALMKMARDPKRLGAHIGFLAVLHTWGQRLDLHPHLHIIVPGGGLDSDKESWISARRKFFLRVEPLAKLFRGKFLDGIRRAARQNHPIFPRRLDPSFSPREHKAWLDGLYSARWVVFSKPSFGGAEGGLSYLARYTHRVAISNARLVRIEDDRVFFRWKDYRDNGKWKLTSLTAVEFIRRFCLHILPPGMQRIRYYGLFANRGRSANLERCRRALGVVPKSEPEVATTPSPEETWEDECERLTDIDPRRCPACGESRLVLLETVPSRAETLRRQARAPPIAA